MNRITITERNLYPRLKNGSVRIFTHSDPTNYGFWYPESMLGSILNDQQIKEVYKNENTIELHVTDEQLNLIFKHGINPFYKK